MPKDAILPDIAKWFQEHGITCLLFDPRGIGASDGEPRNDVSWEIKGAASQNASKYQCFSSRSTQDNKLSISMML